MRKREKASFAFQKSIAISVVAVVFAAAPAGTTFRTESAGEKHWQVIFPAEFAGQ